MKLIMSIRKKIANNFLTFSIVVALLATTVYMIYKHSYVAICHPTNIINTQSLPELTNLVI